MSLDIAKKAWLWLPVVYGPLSTDDDRPCFHVQANGPTVPDAKTGMVAPMTTFVPFYSSVVPCNRDQASQLYGHCYVKWAKALVDEKDLPLCTNAREIALVPKEDRLMAEVSLLEGKDADVEAVFAREASTITTVADKEMAARLVLQMTKRRLSAASAARIANDLDISDTEITERVA